MPLPSCLLRWNQSRSARSWQVCVRGERGCTGLCGAGQEARRQDSWVTGLILHFPATWLAAETLFWRDLFFVQMCTKAGKKGEFSPAVWSSASFKDRLGAGAGASSPSSVSFPLRRDEGLCQSLSGLGGVRPVRSTFASDWEPGREGCCRGPCPAWCWPIDPRGGDPRAAGALLGRSLLEGPSLATLAPSSQILCFPPHRESWHHTTPGRFLVSHGGY